MQTIEKNPGLSDRLCASLISISDASQMLGVSRQRVLQLIQAGLLDASRVGREWLITEISVSSRASTSRLPN